MAVFVFHMRGICPKKDDKLLSFGENGHVSDLRQREFGRSPRTTFKRLRLLAPIKRATAMSSATVPALPPFRPRRWRLAYHLIIVLIVKVILLTLLWHAFIKPYKVKVDIDVMGNRIASAVSSTSPASLTTSPGDNK
jgi:hypothetical protein